MKHVLAALALVVAAGLAPAAPPPGKNPGPFPPTVPHHGTPKATAFPQINTAKPYVNKTFVPNYHLTYGTKFAHGYFYQGFQHNHWTKIYFSPVYGVRVYWCPYTLTEYYWCALDGRFYPVSYRPYGTLVF